MPKDYDPRMHTAEHILNQTMVRLLGCGRCFSAHVNPDKAKCDYHFDRGLTAAETAELEKRINDVIDADLPVTARFIPREEAATKFSLERLPEEAANDKELRIVCVGDYDACPCIGEHVTHTSVLGRFVLVSQTFENGVLRIRFRLRAAV